MVDSAHMPLTAHPRMPTEKTLSLVLYVLDSHMTLTAHAHTPAETNTVIRDCNDRYLAPLICLGPICMQQE